MHRGRGLGLSVEASRSRRVARDAAGLAGAVGTAALQKILVVDDLRGQQLAITAALAELGEEIVTVRSGAEALRRLLDEEFAVILLDVNMPEMDGFETASLIRQRPRSRHTPIIFLTADTNELQAARAYSLGAVDYIVNPFLPETLRAKVKVFVDLARMHQQLKREAEHRIALSREQAARSAAEEESRRLRFLAEAGAVLTRSLDPEALVSDLLLLFVPLLADVAAVVMLDGAGRTVHTSWLDREHRGAVSRDPLPVGWAALQATIQRVSATGKAETLCTAEGRPKASVMPLVARGWTFGVLAAAVDGARHYAAADLDLVRDVAGRAAIALDNSRLYQEINERDRHKDEFLAMLSHELRNPLGAIVTAARLLDRVGSTDDRAVRARDVISRQSGHLTRMVDDLLDVARVTAGRITLSRSAIDLADIVRRAMEGLGVSGRLEHHRVDVRLEPVTINGDVARMEQVVTNLLVNAAKYTDRGGRVEVTVTAEGAEAVLRVSDTGIGISAEMLSRIFEPFTQGRQSLARAEGGLGIGLALARRLVELQGGSIEAASAGPGHGSTFTVRLPRLEPPDVDDDRLDEGRSVPPMRVLIVEDNVDAREMLRTLLNLSGHEVYEAGNGFGGLHLATGLGPLVALIDLGLPGLDGLELASRIRALPDGDRFVLVAVTGYGQRDDHRKTLEAGFDVHLVKPVDAHRLNDVLALAARRATAEHCRSTRFSNHRD